MPPSTAEMLSSLKTYSKCTDDLAYNVRATLLQPFETSINTGRQSNLTQTQLKGLTTRLAPFAMRIVNQNIESLRNLKSLGGIPQSQYNTVVNCLISTSKYALAALEQMSAFTTLKPLDLEKLTSNLISKIVDLREYARALDELCILRKSLLIVTKTPNNTVACKDQMAGTAEDLEQSETVPNPSRGNRGALCESPNRTNDASPKPLYRSIVSEVPGGSSLLFNQREDVIVQKYSGLFNFTFDKSINDQSAILLILSCQMNALRCWIEVLDGQLVWHLPALLANPGNFVDWCIHLRNIDENMARKHFDTLYRQLSRASCKLPPGDGASLRSFILQVQMLRALKYTGTQSIKSLCNRMIQLGITYEKSDEAVDYVYVEDVCGEFVEDLEPNTSAVSELDAYFTMCEYYAYVSRKAKSHRGECFAYASMLRPVQSLLSEPKKCSYFHAAFAAAAKMSIAAVQLDRLTSKHTYTDMSTILTEVSAYLDVVITVTEQSRSQTEHNDQALLSMYKAIVKFRQSCNHFFGYVEGRTKRLREQVAVHHRSPSYDRSFNHAIQESRASIPYMITALQNCKEILPTVMQTIKKKSWKGKQKQVPSPNDIMAAYVDTIVLMARLKFQIDDEETWFTAFEDLSTGQQACEELGFSSGYRWLSGAFYMFGAALANAGFYGDAIYPLRKSCTMLERSLAYAATEAGRLQLAKRYEILGSCCKKDSRFEESITAHRSALKKLPRSSIATFVKKADSLGLYSLIEQNPLIPKLIDRYLRAALIDGNPRTLTFASDMMQLQDLTQEQKCIIFECELRTLSQYSFQVDCRAHQANIADKLMRYYIPSLYPLRRARVLLDRSRIELSGEHSNTPVSNTAVQLVSEANKLLQAKENYGNDSDLLPYRQYYLALSQSWLGICNADRDKESSKTFSIAFRLWGILLRKAKTIYKNADEQMSEADIKTLRDHIDDLDKLYDHFRMLTDFFGVQRQTIYQIMTLRLMLKLNNGLRKAADQISASIIISTRIGRLYDELGYSGKAATEFAIAKSAIEQMVCSNEAEAYYIIFYALHLAKVGELEKSKNIFNTAQIVWESIKEAHANDKLDHTRRKMSQKLILADAHFAMSVLSAIMQSSLDNAIKSCETTLEILSSCNRSLKLEREDREELPKTIEDPFQDSTQKEQGDKEDQGETIITSHIACEESEWAVAEKVDTCLMHLSQLYMANGSAKHAQYYLQKGQMLSEKLRSMTAKFLYLLAMSDLNLRCGRPEMSKANIKLASEIKPSGSNHVLENALLSMAIGDVDAYQGCTEEAAQAYINAETLLKEMRDKYMIMNVEKLIETDETFDYMDTQDLNSTLHGQDSRGNPMLDTTALKNLQICNTIRKAVLLARKDLAPSSIGILERLAEFPLSYTNEIEFYAALVQLKVMSLRRDLVRGNIAIDSREVFLLPSLKLEQSRGSTKRSNPTQQEKIIRDVVMSTELKEALLHQRKNAKKARARFISDAYLNASFLMFIKNHFGLTGRVMLKDYATSSAYYLEMSKGITLRREMRVEVISKLRAPLCSSSAREWPKRLLGQGDRAEVDDPMEIDWDNSNNSRIRPTPLALPSKDPWVTGYLEHLRKAYDEEYELEDTEFLEEITDILPSEWTLCSINIDIENDDLYLVRIQSRQTPIVVKVPLKRIQNQQIDYEAIGYHDPVAVLKRIIEESDATIRDGRHCTDKKAVESWWKKRIQLDQQLKELLKLIEECWFGCFKGFLSGQFYEYQEGLEAFHEAVNQMIYNSVYLQPEHSQKRTRKHIDINVGLCRLLLRLGRHPSSIEVQDAIHFFLSSYVAQGISVDYTQVDFTSLKDQLRDAISAYHANANAVGIRTMERIPNDHVILIPDKHVHMIPLESMDVLRSQSVSRLPCLSFLRDRILLTKAMATQNQNGSDLVRISIDKSKVYYILNPSGDLMHTQREFESTFARMQGWRGVVKKKPLEFRWGQVLEDCDVYMYFGHSAGQSIIRGSTIRRLRRSPVAILMGCSSGSLSSRGEFDPDGYINNFLLGGSPAIVANLWDVTDKSIDKFSRDMMTSWGILGGKGTCSLPEAIAQSRDDCRLPYLIGAAPVVYGVPVYCTP